MSFGPEDQPDDAAVAPALPRLRPRARWMGRGLTFQLKEVKRDRKRDPEPFHDRPPLPQFRLQCAQAERPCLFFTCRHNLYLDVTESGGIKLNFPDMAPEDLEHTCALDAADEGGMTLDQVAALMNLTRERIRQILDKAVAKLTRAAKESEAP